MQRVVDLITITLRKGERALVRGNSERLDFARGQCRATVTNSVTKLRGIQGNEITTSGASTVQNSQG